MLISQLAPIKDYITDQVKLEPHRVEKHFVRRRKVTVHTPLSREVFWHEYAKIPRHTSQNSIAAGNLE